MPADRNQNRQKLQSLLRELFQFDTADLDFGIYKILHHRKGEIERFIECDLLAAVDVALQSYQAGEQAGLEEQLAQEAERVRTGLGSDAIDQKGVVNSLYRSAPLVQGYLALQEKVATSVVAAETEAAIYNDLYLFFSRYYDNGDFISKRRYSSRDPKYFIPYNGEEVMLHWANRDQYYVKSGEHFIDYRFKLEGTAPARSVHFVLDRADVPQDNVKASTDRDFILRSENPVLWDGGIGELTVVFEYRPLTDSETASYLDIYNRLQAKSKQRKTLDRAARCVAMEQVILHELTDNHALRDALALPRSAGAETSILHHHLNQYTARNTSDYFVHKDLGGFLSGQLDFYLKNEVLDIDALIGDGTVESMQHALRRAQVVRTIAEKVIAFLAQIENFQKRLFEKKKFVVETNYCMTLDRIPESFYAEIAANDAQREEWVRLYAIDEIVESDDSPAYRAPLTVAFLRANPYLMVDTRFFGEEFKLRLVTTIESLDEQCDGLLIHSENLQSLDLLRGRYQREIKCIYIDPPYNTGSDGFVYKDSYQHSSWLSMIFDRITYGRLFAKRDAAIFAAIDEVEQPILRQIFDICWGSENFVADIVWAAGRKNDSRLVSVSHEYMLAYAFDRPFLSQNGIQWRQRKKGLDEIYAQYGKLKREFGTDYQAMTKGLKKWFRDLPDSHPAKAHRHYSQIDARGIYFPDNISWPGGGGPKYPVLHPLTNKPVKVPSRGWMTSDPEKMQQWIAEDLVHFGDDENAVPCIKSYLKEREFQAPYSVFYQDGRAATKRLRDVMGSDDFGYPKDETVIAECVDTAGLSYSFITLG